MWNLRLKTSMLSPKQSHHCHKDGGLPGAEKVQVVIFLFICLRCFRAVGNFGQDGVVQLRYSVDLCHPLENDTRVLESPLLDEPTGTLWNDAWQEEKTPNLLLLSFQWMPNENKPCFTWNKKKCSFVHSWAEILRSITARRYFQKCFTFLLCCSF